MSQEPSASDGRLHPAAVAIVLVRELRSLAFTFIPAAFDLLRGTLDVGSFALPLVFGGFALARAVLQFMRFRYRLTGDALVIDSGVFSRSRKVIPVARIQSVDTVQRIAHRVFGVVELRVEVVGGEGGQAEGTFPALLAPDAEGLRRRLLAASRGHEAEVAQEAPPLARLSVGDILLAGLTGGRIATFGLVVGALMQQVAQFFPEDEDLAGSIERGAADLGVPLAVAVAGLVVVLAVVAVLFSLVTTVFVYWDFSLRRTGDDLIVTRGLLEHRRSVIPVRRIQAVRVHENLLRRPFGLASLTVVVAGYGGQGRDAVTSSVLLPVAARARAVEIARAVAGIPFDPAAVRLEPAPRRALTRRLVRAGSLLAGIGVGAAALVGFHPAWGLVAAALAVPYAIGAWRALGHAVEPGYILARAGLLDRVLSIVPIPNVQVVRLTASPFQRARRLASLLLRVPKGRAEIADLDRGRAAERLAEVRAAMLA